MLLLHWKLCEKEVYELAMPNWTFFFQTSVCVCVSVCVHFTAFTVFVCMCVCVGAGWRLRVKICSLAEQSLPFSTHYAVGVICIRLPGSHQVAYEIIPCCHVSIPVIPALSKMSSALNFKWNVHCNVIKETMLQLLSVLVQMSYDHFDWLGRTRVFCW